MIEVVYSFEEFKQKISMDMPVHHVGLYQAVDKLGLLHRLTFRVYGVSQKGHIIVFEAKKVFEAVGKEVSEKGSQIYQEFVQQYAKPLGSTEGRWLTGRCGLNGC